MSKLRGSRHVLVRDLVLACEIGVHADEHGRKQRVRINLDLDVGEDLPAEDRLANVVSYSPFVDRIREMVADGRVNLVETLADRIAAFCLEDQRIRSVRVRVEKLDIYPEADSVGVAIERFNQDG